jgi:hypothetical protein
MTARESATNVVVDKACPEIVLRVAPRNGARSQMAERSVTAVRLGEIHFAPGREGGDDAQGVRVKLDQLIEMQGEDPHMVLREVHNLGLMIQPQL